MRRRTTHRDANVGAVVGQTLRDLAPHKSRTSEYSDAAVGHCPLALANVEANYVTVPEEAHRWKRLLTTASTAAVGAG
jgi:hypothetical protein